MTVSPLLSTALMSAPSSRGAYGLDRLLVGARRFVAVAQCPHAGGCQERRAIRRRSAAVGSAPSSKSSFISSTSELRAASSKGVDPVVVNRPGQMSLFRASRSHPPRERPARE